MRGHLAQAHTLKEDADEVNITNEKFVDMKSGTGTNGNKFKTTSSSV